MQFTKIYKTLKDDKNLNNDDRVCYSYLADRMQSSIQRNNFFDKVTQDYYVIYTIEEMINDLDVGKNTVIKCYKKLEKLGYLIKKRMFNGATKLFLPQLVNEEPETTHNYQSLDSKPAKVYISNSNQTNLNQNKYTNNTNDTEKTELKILAQSLIEKGGLSEKIVSTLSTYSKDRADLYNYAGLIYKAKNKVAQRAIKATNGYNATRLETNNLLNETLADKIQGIIISAEQKAKNKSGYIMRSLINIFEYKANEFMMI